MKASVVIRTFNSERTIGRVLEGVFWQELRDFEVVIVDSGSTDGTLGIVSSYPHVFVDYSGEEFTYSGSLNAGIEAASGEYAVCLSSHCTPTDNEWLGSLVGVMESDGSLAGAWGPLLFGERESESPGDEVEIVDLESFRRKPNHGLQNSNSIIRRELWEERPFSMAVPTCEDQEWAHYFLRRGYLTAQVRRSPVRYRIPQGPYGYGMKVYREFLVLYELFGYRPELPLRRLATTLLRLAASVVLRRRSIAVGLRVAAGTVGTALAARTTGRRSGERKVRAHVG